MRGVLFLFLMVCGCGGTAQPFDLGVALPDSGTHPGPVYEFCRTYCVRPGDCAIAYPNDERCPAGFRCAFNYPCGG